jgi:hypothetical protein
MEGRAASRALFCFVRRPGVAVLRRTLFAFRKTMGNGDVGLADPAAGQDCIMAIEDGGLAGGYGTLW